VGARSIPSGLRRRNQQYFLQKTRESCAVKGRKALGLLGLAATCVAIVTALLCFDANLPTITVNYSNHGYAGAPTAQNIIYLEMKIAQGVDLVPWQVLIAVLSLAQHQRL